MWVSLYAKRFSARQWSFLGPGSENTLVLYEWRTVHKENGTELQSRWCWHLQKSKHPVFRSTSPLSRGSAQKHSVVENCQYTIVITHERFKLFFAQLFLLISSVFTEQSQICAKNVTPAMIEQGDLLWQDNLTHCSCRSVMKTHIPLTDDPAQPEEDLLQRYKERIEK